MNLKHVCFELVVQFQLTVSEKAAKEKEWIEIKQSGEKKWKLLK